MKMSPYEILDTPFVHSFEDFLEEDEKVIWSGQPKIHDIYWDIFKLGFLLFFLNIISEPSSHQSTFFWVIAILAILHALLIYLKNKKRKQTFYVITPTRILFQFPNKEINQLEFDKIDTISYSTKRFNKKIGTISIILKNAKYSPFVTYSIDKFIKYKHPTFESIENVQDVAELIIKAIQEKS